MSYNIPDVLMCFCNHEYHNSHHHAHNNQFQYSEYTIFWMYSANKSDKISNASFLPDLTNSLTKQHQFQA